MRTLRGTAVGLLLVTIMGGPCLAVAPYESEPAGSVSVVIENRSRAMDGHLVVMLLEGVPRVAGGDSPTRPVGSFVAEVSPDMTIATDIVRAEQARDVDAESPVAVMPQGIHTIHIGYVPGEPDFTGSPLFPIDRESECTAQVTVREGEPALAWVMSEAIDSIEHLPGK